MLNPLLIKIGIFFASIIAAFSLGYMVHGWKTDSTIARQYKNNYAELEQSIATQQEENQKLTAQYQQNAKAYQLKIGTLNGQIKTEIIEHTVYRECILPDTGLQLIRSAIIEANKIKSPQ